MVTVYLDESGHETDDHVVVAGFLGTEDQWSAFDSDWLKVLDGATSFHAKSQRWTKESTGRRVAKLSAIPYRNGLRSIIGSVCVSDYADLLQNKAEEYVNQGYVLCLYPILSAISYFIPETEEVKWILEEQHDYMQAASAVFKQFAVMYGPSRFSDIEFVPAGRTQRLQPADLLAYGMLQQLRNPKSQKAMRSRAIIGNDPWGSVVERETVRSILEPSLKLINQLQQTRTGIDHTQVFKRYQSKREVHDAIREANEKRAAQNSDSAGGS
jgi:hypothetical protein